VARLTAEEINTLKHPLTGIQHEIMTGLLLGDGSLAGRENSRSNASLSIERSAEDINYLLWQHEIFHEYITADIYHRGCPAPTINGKLINNKIYEMASIKTRRFPVFTYYYDIWYKPWQDKIIKMVPRNIELTPLTLAVWFADDGHIKTRASKYRFYLRLCTEGFLPEDVEFLATMLSKRYNEHFSLLHLGIAKDGHEKLRIVACDSAARKLLQEIDNVFPESMARKSEIWRKTEARFYTDVPPLADANFKNRMHPSAKEILTLKVLQKFGPTPAKELLLPLNTIFAANNLSIMTEQYSVKFIERLYKRGILKREKRLIEDYDKKGGNPIQFFYFVN